jgi:hypothetical protein
MNDETPTLISFQFIVCNNEIKIPMHFQFHTGAMRQDKVPICDILDTDVASNFLHAKIGHKQSSNVASSFLRETM